MIATHVLVILTIILAALYFLIGFGIMIWIVNESSEPTLLDKVSAGLSLFFWPLWIPAFIIAFIIVVAFSIYEDGSATTRNIIKWFKQPNRKEKP